MNQQLVPGAPLSIDALARDLQMSNTPVREALARLTADRLVVQVQNRGFLVSALPSETELAQMSDVRQLIELHIVETFEMHRLDTVDFAEIIEANRHPQDGPTFRDYRVFNRHDENFHRILVGLSGNPFLVRAWEDLHIHLQVARLYSGTGIIGEQEAADEHLAIIEALQRRDRAAAVAATRRHMDESRSRLRDLYRSAIQRLEAHSR